MSNYARMLAELLEKPDTGKPLRRDQLRFASIEGVESIAGCTKMAFLLFMMIYERHGDRAARQIFAKWGTPPSPGRIRQIKNLGLFDRLDLMKPEPNVSKLAREIAAENRALSPRMRPKGPTGSTDENTIDRHIRRLQAKRRRSMQVGTWWGPFPP